MKHLISAILIFLLGALLLTPYLTVSAYASKISEKKIVRVGWFASDGVHAVDHDGTRCGYDYDYLQAISQYTNWEYEFVEGTWSECYDWLKNGDIDLLGIVNKTPEREQIFDYSYTSAGTEMCCLFVDLNDKRYSYQDFERFDGMTIAIEEGTYQSTVLKEYAAENNFTYNTISYPTLAEAQHSVDIGETDALLSSNTDIIAGYKAVAQFNPIPFYYATTKGNTELLKELNYAMNELLTYYPKFSNDLYSLYYGNIDSSDAVFTAEEKAYIQSSPNINVLYDLIWYPIESYNKKTDSCEGIVPDLLSLISKKSGIKFNYVSYANSVDVLKSFENPSGNIVTSITYDYKWAKKNDVNITQPFLSTSVVCATRNPDITPKTVALVRLDYISEMVKTHMPDLKPIYFDSMSECVEAVSLGIADCAYLNNYESEYYLTIGKYRALSFHTTDLFRQNICLGVSKEADPLLFSIISKSLQSIPTNDMQNLIYKNSYHVAPATLESFARANPILIIFIAVSFILVLLLLLRNEMKTARRIGIENERYEQLAAMTDEYMYEYSYENDFLSFNNITANFLGGIKEIPNYSIYVRSHLCDNQDMDNTLYSCFMNKKDLTKEINTDFFENKICWYRISSKIIHDNNNQAIYAIGKIQNIQHDHDEKEHLKDKANRDGMTGLYNSEAFSAQVENSVSAGSVLLIMDVDCFKYINDHFGHYHGDVVLTSIAAILDELFSPLGIVSRLGGDEFSVFIARPLAQDVLENLCKKVLERVACICINSESHVVTLSIGAAIASSNQTYPQLYQHADSLLYEVKRNNRNGYRIG